MTVVRDKSQLDCRIRYRALLEKKKLETCYHNQNIFVEERRHTILLELIPLLIREARNTSQNICEYITKHFISAISQLT